ncbi:mucin-17 isoform X6 [Drosophila erecta]|uniref:mucin-17 isoform X6 n=1 Tax=Drosophila erecta TaxID=7220 RepID=UPI000F0720D8|nr:mucin-17 isoform X6 [Drosophila erecta]
MAGEVPAATSPAGRNTSNIDNNNQESSPDPVQQQLNSSADSGIAVLEAESPTLRRRQRLHQCQRILQVLQRDQLTHQQLRDRLSKLANKKWRKEESSEDHACNVCCADLDLSSAKNYVTCCTCGKSVCRGLKCADWRPKDAKWECQLCQSSKESLAHTSSWVAEQMSFNQHKFVYPMRARSEVYIPIVGDGNDSSMQFESVSQIGHTAHMDERAKIREYVEEIVAEMLGGNLDHVKVGQLSKSENYLQLFDKFHAKLSNLLMNVENSLCARALRGDLPAIVNGHTNNNNNNNNADSELTDLSQTRLRSLIETIIAETLRSSSLSASGAVSEISLDTRSHVSELANGNGLKRRHRTEHYFEPKVYQDLLATAVLNKIADKEGNTRLAAESTPDLSGRHIDENFNAEALSTTSGSSIEPRSDCSLTDHEIGLDNGKSQSLKTDLERESVLSDYIAAHMVPLPDFSASVTESEDDIGSISSGMIGDGNWEDNWLFKKKRSSATPSSIGMLVPAPRENVRAQIGDKTTDEVSDLSEMGSDIEESSLDLLRCNDLNDRLLSKHLIGGQNTKLVLDELVDRTSLTSHTLLEENEPAFTETTNEFVVSPMAVPSDIKAPSPTPPPPPMIFQDDLLHEEPEHTPIAAHGESEELSSLDGCTGFSTVEYIDEGQMHDTVPSVIEILAAMALGPMLAVPASEQPAGMTPSEMHTLKELSDLALAEINARTVDLVHAHSLDIIEEEYTEPSEAGPEQNVDFVQHPPLEGITSTEQLSPGDQEGVVQMDVLPPPPQLNLIPEIEPPPPPIELPQDIKSTASDPQNPAEAVPELATVEVVSEMNTDDITPLENVQNVPELTSSSDIVPEVQSYVETIKVDPTPESVSLPVETGPEIPVICDVPDPVVIDYSELHSVDPPEVINLVSLDLEPPKPLECVPETVQTQEHQLNHGLETNFDTGDPTANLPDPIPEMIADPIAAALPEPSLIPVPVDSGTEVDKLGTIEVDSQSTSVPIETVSEPKIVDPQLPVDADDLTQSAPVNSPEPQNIAIDSSLPLEEAAPVQSTPIEGATVDSPQSVDTELPAAVENSVSVGILRENVDVNVCETVDVPIETDSIAGTQPQAEETVVPPASVEIDSENQPVALDVNAAESQAISEEGILTIETISPPFPTEVALQVKFVGAETSVSEGVTESAPVEPSNPVEPDSSSDFRESDPQTKIANLITPSSEIVQLENNPSIELQDELQELTASQSIPESESCAVDPQAEQPVAVNPLPDIEVVSDVVALEPPSLEETDPETQAMAIENPEPMEMIPTRLAEAESIDTENEINPENLIEQPAMSVEPQPTVPMDATHAIENVQEIPCNTLDSEATTELPIELVDMGLPVSVEFPAQSESVGAVSLSGFVLDTQSQSLEQPEHVENAAHIEIEEMVSQAHVEIVPTTTEDFLQAESVVESVEPIPAGDEVQPIVYATAALQIAPIQHSDTYSEQAEKDTAEPVEVGLDTQNVAVQRTTSVEKTPTATDGASTELPVPPETDYVTASLAAEEIEANEAIQMQSVTDATLPEETVTVEVKVPEPVDLIQESISAEKGENPPETQSEFLDVEHTPHEEVLTESLEKDSQKSADAVDLQEDSTEAEENVDPLPTTEVAPDIIASNPSSHVELSTEIPPIHVPLDIVPEAESTVEEQQPPVEKLESNVVDSDPVVIDQPVSAEVLLQDKVASAPQQIPENKSVEEDLLNVSIGAESVAMEPITTADGVPEQNSRAVEPNPSTPATPVEVIASEPLDTVVEPVAVVQSPTIEDTMPQETTQSDALDSTGSLEIIQADPKEPSAHVEIVSQSEASAWDPEESAKDTTPLEQDSVGQATQVSVTDSIAVESSVPVKRSEDSLPYVLPAEVNQPAPEEIPLNDSVAVELSDPVERALDSLENTDFVAEAESAGADNEIGVDPEINQLEKETSELNFTALTVEESTSIDGKPSVVLEPLETICQAESTNLDRALPEILVAQDQSVPKSLPTNVTIQTQPSDLETQPSTKPMLETENVDVVEVNPVAVDTSAVESSLETEKRVLKAESSDGEPLAAAESVALEPPIPVAEYTSVDSANSVPQLESVPLSVPAALRIQNESEDFDPEALENPLPEPVSCTEDLLEPAQVLLQEDPVDMEDRSGMLTEPSSVEIVPESADKNAIASLETNSKPETEAPSPMDAESTPDVQVVASEAQELVPAAPVMPLEFVPEIETSDLTEETKNETAEIVSEPRSAEVARGTPPIPVECIQEEQPLSLGNNDPVDKDITSAPVEAPSDTASTESNANEEAQCGEDNLKKDDVVLKSVTANSDLSSDAQLASIDQESQEIAADPATEGSIAEREVKKWYNAVEMPNNPYSPEALKQRISGTQERYMDVPNISPSAEQKALASALTENPDPPADPPKTDYKRYSRDYYINNAPTATDSTGSGNAATTSAPEDVEDIVINEAQKASKPATEQDPPQESVYKATPVQVLDESLDSQSNPSLYSLQTTTTNTSDESDTVRIYDFNKQETTVIRAAPAEQQPSDSTTSSMESAQCALPSVSSSIDSSVSNKRERPVVLQFGPGDSVPTIGSPASTPTRGSTPPAFRFLQPKRRLIDPSQVLSVDEDDVPETTTPAAEKPVIEDEVAHSMPSVKALAQAFLLTSKHTQPQRRWRAKVRIAAPPDTPDKPNTSLAKRHKLEHAVSMAEVADESTIASDLSSLETDPSIHSEANPPVASPASPVPVRHGFLRSNIAFFENLKFK